MSKLELSQFTYQALQVVSFYSGVHFSAAKLLPLVLSELNDQLGGDPVSLPLPADAPAEIPRIILSSKDKTLRMQISPLRVDLRWEAVSDVPVQIHQVCDLARKGFSVFSRATNAKPTRLALVVTRYHPTQNPAALLASHFCRPEFLVNLPEHKAALARPENFELHAHKITDLGQFRVNSWIRFKSANLQRGPKSDRIILVEQDLNTATQAKDNEFDLDRMSEFHKLCMPEFDNILRLYISPE